MPWRRARFALPFPWTVPAPYAHALTQYRIEPRIRANTSLTRDTLIPLVAACVPSEGGHRVDLANPDVIVVVEVLRNICGIGTLDEYERWAKWNMQTIAERHTARAS